MVQAVFSVFVLIIAGLIYKRYRSIFSLPFFWAAYFAFQYLGLLQIAKRSGGATYCYAALAFAMFFLGLLAADFLIARQQSGVRIKGAASEPNGKVLLPPSRADASARPTRVKLPFAPASLVLGIACALAFAVFISLTFFSLQGIPILSTFPSLAWVTSTSGIPGRTMSVFGPSCFAGITLAAYGVARTSKWKLGWALALIGALGSLIAVGLLGTKANAILLFIWFNMILFYLNKRTRWVEVIVPLVFIVIPVSVAMVALRQTSEAGYWEGRGVYQIYYERVTLGTATPVDFAMNYMRRFGQLHGGGLELEVTRIVDQVRGTPKTPLLSEFVFNLIVGQSTNETGFSAGLALYGMGYVEFGLVGMLAYSFIQGLAFSWAHHRFLAKDVVGLAGLLIWGTVLKILMNVSVTGAVLMSFQGGVLEGGPPLLLVLAFSSFFALPFARGLTSNRVRHYPRAQLTEKSSMGERKS